jgi:hypothetical protein
MSLTLRRDIIVLSHELIIVTRLIRIEFGGHWVCLEDDALNPLTLLNGHIA